MISYREGGAESQGRNRTSNFTLILRIRVQSKSMGFIAKRMRENMICSFGEGGKKIGSPHLHCGGTGRDQVQVLVLRYGGGGWTESLLKGMAAEEIPMERDQGIQRLVNESWGGGGPTKLNSTVFKLKKNMYNVLIYTFPIGNKK